MPRRIARAVALIPLLISGCAFLAPLPRESSLRERLAAFPTERLPLQGPVTVHWDDRMIPFIDAEHDLDAAFVLGLVHAHLRLGQMEVFRRIATGRIAEMGGPLAADIDHGLRIIGFRRAAETIEPTLPAETRAWLGAFVAGVNHQMSVAELPPEFAMLDLEREPWTVRDVLAIGRLAGTDVNWLVWFNLLQLRQRPDWPQIWTRLVKDGGDSVPSFTAGALGELLGGVSKSGSNSVAVAGHRSRSGGALMANDPHLGIQLPNVWLIAGISSPSYNVVGLMAPGLPIWAIGRNPRIAWGGTNMRAAASNLYDVSKLPAAEIIKRRETIRVRWWLDREITVRETRYGPILSDAPQLQELGLPPTALRWTGYQPSDELGAMLRVAKAQSFGEFRAAFDDFAVPGQNMLYADADGNIGQVMAVRLPKRTGPPPPALILDAEGGADIWDVLADAGDLPHSFNPEKGFLASANNMPAKTDIQIGYFFSPDDRMQRMHVLLEHEGSVGIDDLKRLQQDVVMPSARELAELYLRKLEEHGLAAPDDANARTVINLLRDWDGGYESASRAPVAFELFRDAFTKRFYETSFGEQDWAAYAGVARIRTIMVEDIATSSDGRLKGALEAALAQAAQKIGGFASWGDMHRLGLSHPLGYLPVIGSRFRFIDVPVSGSSDTLMKTAHSTTSERHDTRYGSNARHISDLSDPDRNWFVLLGGQDGWFNSAAFLDQVEPWRAGEYVEVPLRVETVRQRFRYRTDLNP